MAITASSNPRILRIESLFLLFQNCQTSFQDPKSFGAIVRAYDTKFPGASPMCYGYLIDTDIVRLQLSSLREVRCQYQMGPPGRALERVFILLSCLLPQPGSTLLRQWRKKIMPTGRSSFWLSY